MAMSPGCRAAVRQVKGAGAPAAPRTIVTEIGGAEVGWQDPGRVLNPVVFAVVSIVVSSDYH